MCAERSSTISETSAAKPPASKKKSDRARAARVRARANTLRRLGCGALCAVLAAGCSIIGKRAGDTLSTIVLDQSDPELVASGLPAYLLFVDGLIAEHPDNVNLLSAGAQMFALYGSRFATGEHAVSLTAKARRYGERAIC